VFNAKGTALGLRGKIKHPRFLTRYPFAGYKNRPVAANAHPLISTGKHAHKAHLGILRDTKERKSEKIKKLRNPALREPGVFYKNKVAAPVLNKTQNFRIVKKGQAQAVPKTVGYYRVAPRCTGEHFRAGKGIAFKKEKPDKDKKQRRSNPKAEEMFNRVQLSLRAV
jgi:hypothetical protein